MSFTHKLNKLPKSTVEAVVSIKWNEIQKAYEQTFERIKGIIEIEGFRKGKAPKEVVEKHLKKEDVYQETIRDLFPRIYQEIVQKEALKPITSPKIELVKAKENEDWEIKLQIAQKPNIVLGDYKANIKKLKGERKKDEIWVPGKDKEKKEPTVQDQKFLNEVLNLLLKEVKCEVPDLILEEELNRKLSQLVDDVSKLGLTMESYLASKNLTLDQLKAQYLKEIEDTYKLEFILLDIADQEKITVEKNEIEKLFEAIKDTKERKQAEANSYFYASILRKQKTLDFLTSL